MARVQYGSIITDMAGSIGGLTFQHNKAAKIVRQRPYTRKMPNAAQSARINAFYEVISAWRELSGAYKDDWSNAAASLTFLNRWGEEKVLNGYQMFQKLQGNRLLCGLSMYDTPPASPSSLAIPDFILDIRTTSYVIDFDGSFDHTGFYLFFFTSYLQRSPAYYDRKILRLTKVLAPGTTTDIDIFAEYQAVHNNALSALTGGAPVTSICSIMAVQSSTGWPGVFNQQHDYV